MNIMDVVSETALITLKASVIETEKPYPIIQDTAMILKLSKNGHIFRTKTSDRNSYGCFDIANFSRDRNGR